MKIGGRKMRDTKQFVRSKPDTLNSSLSSEIIERNAPLNAVVDPSERE